MTDRQKSFHELHVEVMDTIIKWCKKHNINADFVDLHGDGLENSIEFDEWTPATDSSLCLFKETDKGKEPIIYSM